MSFKILYVENDDKDFDPVAEAVAKHNAESAGEKLTLVRAFTPEELAEKIELGFDAVLADVYFDDDRADYSDIDDGLDIIIQNVDNWRRSQPIDRLLPIIAYTGMGDEALKRCLAAKWRLFDIWDKNTALPEYVAWRLSKLAVEVARSRPDARLQSLISGMPKGARWHDGVAEMVRRYDAGWTERDQIERAGTAIADIAHKMGVWKECAALWGVMQDWEWLGRAASRGVRGHARHVINVFWLGYFLLNSAGLFPFFRKAWLRVIAERNSMANAAKIAAREALCDTWFYAGLFHDVGGSLERAQALLDKQFELVTPLLVSREGAPRVWVEVTERLRRELFGVAEMFEPKLRGGVEEVLTRGLEQGGVDHGCLAACYLRRPGLVADQACLAREASRAVALHNLFPDLSLEAAGSVSWEEDPIVCLLLLCDQLQTWDRERGDETLNDDDRPQRAELSKVEVNGGKRPKVNIRIDYIVRPHVLRSPVIYERVKVELEHVLKARPDAALQRIRRPWPFDVAVECSLSGSMLTTTMNFG